MSKDQADQADRAAMLVAALERIRDLPRDQDAGAIAAEALAGLQSAGPVRGTVIHTSSGEVTYDTAGKLITDTTHPAPVDPRTQQLPDGRPVVPTENYREVAVGETLEQAQLRWAAIEKAKLEAERKR